MKEKLINWALGEIQHRRGRGAIVMSELAVLEPVSRNPENLHEYSPVCVVKVPVILESRQETIDHYYFSNKEVSEITGKYVV